MALPCGMACVSRPETMKPALSRKGRGQRVGKARSPALRSFYGDAISVARQDSAPLEKPQSLS